MSRLTVTSVLGNFSSAIFTSSSKELFKVTGRTCLINQSAKNLRLQNTFIRNAKLFCGINGMKPRFNFSELTSSFKSRSKLSEFYKNVHPDILGNAPEKIKEENSRSLKSLNAYLDSLSQNQGGQAMKLVFYVPDKVNKKAKKYISIAVNLKDVSANITQDSLKTQIEQTHAILLNEIKDVRMQTNPFLGKQSSTSSGAENFVDEGEDVDDLIQKHQQTMRPIKKHATFMQSMTKQMDENKLGRMVFQHINEYNHLKTVEKIREELYYMDTPSQKPLLWATLLANDTGLAQNTEQLFTTLIDPRLIFVDETLTQEHLNAFLKTVIVSDMVLEERVYKELKEVFQHMEQYSPSVCLYITKHYSGSDMPGFFSIPYNFKPSQVSAQYEKYGPIAIEARQEMDYLASKIDKLKRELKASFQIEDIVIPQAATADEYNSQLLFLKKLKKLVSDLFIADRNLYNRIQLKKIVCSPKAASAESTQPSKHNDNGSHSRYTINLNYIFSDDDFLKQL